MKGEEKQMKGEIQEEGEEESERNYSLYDASEDSNGYKKHVSHEESFRNTYYD